MTMKTLKTDVLVVGGGGAGLRAALAVAEGGAEVVVTSKGPLSKSGITPVAMRGFQAPLDPRDTRESYYDDVVKEGRYLADEDLVWTLASEARETFEDLLSYGVEFRRDEKGDILQAWVPGQSTPRSVLLARGGVGLTSGLARKLRASPQATILEDVIVLKILKSGDGVCGALIYDMRSSELTKVLSGAVVMATGGNEALWPHTDCPPESTGSGMVLAYECGAELVDMEQVLFYPSVVKFPTMIAGTIVPYEVSLDPDWIGGKIVNALGEEFLPPGKPPVRDTLMKLMYREILAGRGTEHGAVYLDLTRSPKGREEVERLVKIRLPDVEKQFRQFGVDLLEQPLEIAPASHYTLGGIHIDVDCATNVKGLFAAGECSGNVHGANRLSGNALTETQVFGRRAGRSALRYAGSVSRPAPSDEGIGECIAFIEEVKRPKQDGVSPYKAIRELKQILDRHAGIERDQKSMEQGLEKIARLRETCLGKLSAPSAAVWNMPLVAAIEFKVMLDMAVLVTRSAMERKETRGHHIRTDYPDTLPEWRMHTMARRRDGELKIGRKAVRKIERRGNGG